MTLVDNPEVARCLFHEAIEAHLLIDPRDRRILDANAAALRLTGYTDAEIGQLRVQDLFESPAPGGDWTAPLGIYDGYWLRGAGGRRVSVRITASRLHTAPMPLGLLVAHELRGQGRPNVVLVEDEGRVHDLFSVSPDAIFVEDLNGTILDVNARACQLHGEPRERLVGRNVLELVPEEQREQVRESFPRLVSGELSFVDSFSRTADGRDIPVELRVNRVTYQGRPALLLHVRDISPRKRAEASLSESRRFIERIAEASPHIMYVFDPIRGTSIYANRVVGRDLGYTADEIAAMGEDLLPRLLHPDDRTRLPQLLGRWRTARDGEVLEAEYRMRHRDGSWHWFHSRDTVFARGPGGEVTQVIGTAEDVTDRKRAEQEVLASKRMLEVVMNNIPQGVFWKDLDSRYLGCNQVMAEALGLGSPANIVGRIPSDLFCLTAEQAASSLAEDRQVIETGGAVLDFDQPVTRADGSTIWLETCKLPLLDADGRVIGVVGTWQDVTERKSNREELQRRNRLLASLSSCQARFIAGGELRAVFEELLRTLLVVTGSEYGFLGEVLRGEDGRPYLKTYAITDISWDEESSRLFRESAASGLEFRNLDTLIGAVLTTGQAILTNDPAGHPGSGGLPRGHPPLRAFLGLPFYQGQEVVGMVGIANRPDGYGLDLVALLEPFLHTCASMVVATRTDRARREAEEERRRLEAQLLHAQKLESLGVLAGGIAHDFNNLLTGILGYTNLAAMQMSPDSKAGPLLAEAEKAAHRAADLVRQLLAYAGKGRFVIQLVDLNALAREMLTMLRSLVSRKAQIHTDFAPDLPRIDADATQLRQVVMNLITNASEALGDREGTLTLRTVVERVSDPRAYSSHASPDAQPGAYVLLEVADSGCGMSLETRGRIFDPFFTTKFSGRGLGLAAVLGIVRGHRGILKLTSEVGRGTTFQVLFPRAEATSPPEPVAVGGKVGPSGVGIVLVVDDEEAIRSLAAHALRDAGYQVIVAGDGEEGLAVVRAAGPKVRAVVMDLTMPGLDGVEATRRLYQMRETVPVILMSGYGEPHVMANLTGARFAGFLQKPFVAETLLKAVREAIEPRPG